MRVKGRDLVHLGERELHLGGERREMNRGEMPVAVLDKMQVLDQEIAPAWAQSEERLHLLERLRIDLAALRSAPRLSASTLAVRRRNVRGRLLSNTHSPVLLCV